MRFLHKGFVLVTCFFLSLLFSPTIINAQVVGCKDPLATNYNPQATVNDGSCTYTATSYTPPAKVDPINAVLVETSGLEMANNFLWSFNDGGGQPAIYRIDTLTNTLLQTVTLAGATNVDWEAIQFDGTYFYIGDFGNNANGARTDLKIYRFPISAIPDHTTNPTATVPSAQIEVLNFIYTDQVQPPVATTANNTKFDCEAMIVDAGIIHLFSKNWVDVNTTHYILQSNPSGVYTAVPTETLATNYLVTDADKAVGQQIISLLGYQNSGTANHYMHILSDYSVGLFFNGNKRRIDLPDALTMGQAEGLTYRNGTYGYISNEKFTRAAGSFTITVNQKLRSFNTTSFVSPTVLPLELKQFNVSNTHGSHKIAWSFETAVENLQLQVSSNGTSFNDLKNYSRSISDVYYNNATGPINCYRLAWQKNGGSIQYSNNVCISGEIKNDITKVSLKANGELSFMLTGSNDQQYAFKVITTDGKLLTETPKRTYSPGLNRISLAGLSTNSFVFIIATTNQDQQAKLIQVNK